MWERLVGWFSLLWDSGKKLNEQAIAIDELQESNQQLARAVQHLFAENERLHDAIRHERELRESSMRELKLEVRLQISEELRRLPPGDA